MARSRVSLDDDVIDDADNEDGGDYFTDHKSNIDFINTGSTQLNCVIGGTGTAGWPMRRIVNIAGDEATGKTLLCIEAARNFKKKYPKGEVYYRETESAFDEDYAEAIGMPIDQINFLDPDEQEEFRTVERFYDDLLECCDEVRKRDVPGLYILDSLDALSDEDELARDFDKGSYGTGKAKNMSKAFRMLTGQLARSNMCLVIISQTRDKISAQGIPGKTKGGGRAVNFYSSIILWLSHVETMTRTRAGIKRAYGIKVRVRCSKNKIFLPHRSCEFVITFGRGIDDFAANIDFLEDAKALQDVVGVTRKTYNTRLEKMTDDEYWDEADRISEAVVQKWQEADREQLAEVRSRPRR